MPISLVTNNLDGARIKVVGVGGGGGNALNTMVEQGIEGVEFIAINTDAQALEKSKAHVKIQIGKNVTKGLGAGMNTENGLKAVEECREEIQRALQGSDMIFITAGMGGGTGTGASPLIAHMSRTLDALVVAIVTKPFKFEGKPRMKLADQGISSLKDEVDSLIVIPNERILEEIDRNMTYKEAFKLADRVLYNSTKGISQIITKSGEINVDFADVRTIMKGKGDAVIGTGFATGENKAVRAAEEALTNKLLENINIEGSECVLVNICSDGNALMSEIEEINSFIQERAGEDAQYIFGLVEDEGMGDGIMVTVIATGFNAAAQIKTSEKTESTDSLRTGTRIKQIHIFGREEGSILNIPTDSQLKNYDKPAIDRRNISIDDDLNETVSKEEDIFGLDSDTGFNYQELKQEEDFIKPSFLRKQMD